MSWFSGIWGCDPCAVDWEDVVPRGDRDAQKCPQCGGAAARRPAAPMVLRASYPDGKRRFDGLREQDRLDRAFSEARTADDQKRVLIEKDKLSGKS